MTARSTLSRVAGALAVGLSLSALLAPAAQAQAPAPAQAPHFTSQELASRTVYRRAVDAVIWGVPAVNLDMMRQAYFRDAKASYNDIVWWPKGGGWKNQSLDVDTSVRYLYIFCNTKSDGPIVLDVPPAVTAASFYGTAMDTWQVPLVDLGLEGKGGKYLILPPDYKGDVPAGYIPVRPKTYNTYTLLRSILATRSEADVHAGDALVKQVKVYPLSKAGNPPEPRFIDATDIIYNAVVPYDDSFYDSLARVINEEPVQARDLQMLGMLLPLGIEKGKEFKPDLATRTQLKGAAAEAHAWLIEGIISTFERYYPDGKWTIPTSAIGVKTEFLWEVPNYFDVDARGITLASFFGPVSKLGGGSFYLSTYYDKSGAQLSGENTYRLHVPSNVPASQFWALTVYDLETEAFFRDSTHLTVDSLDKAVRKNADGSVDIDVGPKAPAGMEANWIYTPPGKKWYPWFRFYGPEKAIFDKSWRLPDIERIN
jgi:hypothetical protein